MLGIQKMSGNETTPFDLLKLTGHYFYKTGVVQDNTAGNRRACCQFMQTQTGTFPGPNGHFLLSQRLSSCVDFKNVR